MRAWVHFMQDTVKERLSLRWHDWVNPMWWHPPPPLWGCVSLQWIHLCLPFFAQVPEVILLHMGKALLPLIFTLDIIHTPRGGVYIYIFSPSEQTLGKLVWAEAYFLIKEHVHYLSVWFSASLFLFSLWLGHSMAAHPVFAALSSHAGITDL